MWNHSPDKLELLFDLSSKRKVRESALEDLRGLNVLATVIGAAFSKDGSAQFNQSVAQLEKLAGMAKTPDAKKSLSGVASRLRAMGATIVDG